MGEAEVEWWWWWWWKTLSADSSLGKWRGKGRPVCMREGEECAFGKEECPNSVFSLPTTLMTVTVEEGGGDDDIQ